MIFYPSRNYKIRKVLLIVLFLTTSLNIVVAQRCVNELSAELSDEMLLEPATGRVAARLFKKTVELLEPAMPPFKNIQVSSLSSDDPDYPVLKYLADRGDLARGLARWRT